MPVYHRVAKYAFLMASPLQNGFAAAKNLFRFKLEPYWNVNTINE
jgi:hypothetical protein